MKEVELLAPAGDIEKLKMAIIYGADAVYLAGESFGLRKASKNFTVEQLKEATDFVHERGKKIYITMNIIPHNDDFTVRVRTKGGEWKETFEYKVQVDMEYTLLFVL